MILIAILAIIATIIAVLLTTIQIQYIPMMVKEPLYKYLLDPNIQKQYKEYQVCKPFTTKENCSSQPSCLWYENWFDGYKQEYCINKDYQNFIELYNEKYNSPRQQDNLPAEFKNTL